VVGVLALHVIWPFPGHEQDWPWVMGLTAFPVTAAIVLARRPGNVIGRLLGLVGTSAGAIFVVTWYVLAYPQAPLSRQVEAIEAIPAVLQFGGILGLLHLFPSGRPVNGFHRWIVRALWWYIAAASALGLTRPGALELTGRPNPFGLGPLWLRDVYAAADAVLVPFVVLGFWAVFARWRRAGSASGSEVVGHAYPVERAQLKWFFAGATWVLIAALMIAVAPEDSANPVVNLLSYAVAMGAFWSLPIAVVIAITRYRLFDIDRIVSRTIAYTVVAGVLSLVYMGSVVGLQAIVPTGGSDVAVAGSTLAAAAVFRPVRRRVQVVVDQRFNRARYEAAVVTQDYTRRLRHQVDLDAVTVDLLSVVARTMHPSSASIWLRARSE
jgi:hypothetical protein